MKVSRRAEHAVRAVLDLALHAPKSGGNRSLEIARRTGIPEKFLDVILLDLRKAGILTSKRGPDGGHWLAQDPARLSVGAILLAIDGKASIAARPDRGGSAPVETCLRGLWASVREAAGSVLHKITVEDLRRQIQQQVLDYSI